MVQSGPTIPPPQPETLNTALYRNIDALKRHHDEQMRAAGFHERLADRITSFAGSFYFIYIHLALFGFWIVANLGWIGGIAPWDPQFVVLAMIASVEPSSCSTGARRSIWSRDWKPRSRGSKMRRTGSPSRCTRMRR